MSLDRSSHVYKHLQASESPVTYQVKLKEYVYIKWEKPDLNQQVKHINLKLSL